MIYDHKNILCNIIPKIIYLAPIKSLSTHTPPQNNISPPNKTFATMGHHSVNEVGIPHRADFFFIFLLRPFIYLGGTSAGKNSCGKNSVPNFGTIISRPF
jgi:hypothetical protein